ncbi:MAG: D-Ala-D-Ala carboxypeptidase family metallohydrolase [Myxococcales bacterium]
MPVLRFVQKELVPELGELEVMSAYRTEAYNEPAGGARRSRHCTFGALDLQPKNAVARKDLHAKLTRLWKAKGKETQWGLGLYSGTRFHVDVWRYRTW